MLFFILLLVLTLLLIVSRSSKRKHCPPPTNGAIAQYCPDTDTYAINDDKLRQDLECNFCYFRHPRTPTGEQKREVFRRMDPDGRNLAEYVDRKKPGDLKRYRKFVVEHEKAHQRLHRHRHVPPDLMHEDNIQMEVEANREAYKVLRIPLTEKDAPLAQW